MTCWAKTVLMHHFNGFFFCIYVPMKIAVLYQFPVKMIHKVYTKSQYYIPEP